MRDANVIRRDIRDDDLNDVLTEFYAIIGADPLLARYFAEVDMLEHMPKIVAFWSTLLFRTRSYTGNAFRPHMAMPGLTGAHFARWVGTLESVVDARFAGPSASLMKELAHRIAYSMQLRLGISPFEPFRATA
jgi:hemoglobin